MAAPRKRKGTRQIQRAVAFSDNQWERLRVESMRSDKSMSLIIREAVDEHLDRLEAAFTPGAPTPS